MKYTKIEEVFGAETNYLESIRQSESYWFFMEKAMSLCKKLENQLPSHLQKDFEQLITLSANMESETQVTHFISGVKVGLLIGTEAFPELRTLKEYFLKEEVTK